VSLGGGPPPAGPVEAERISIVESRELRRTTSDNHIVFVEQDCLRLIKLFANSRLWSCMCTLNRFVPFLSVEAEVDAVRIFGTRGSAARAARIESAAPVTPLNFQAWQLPHGSFVAKRGEVADPS
jgi:hypothetical protein